MVAEFPDKEKHCLFNGQCNFKFEPTVTSVKTKQPTEPGEEDIVETIETQSVDEGIIYCTSCGLCSLPLNFKEDPQNAV